MLYESICETPIGLLKVTCTETGLHSVDRVDEAPRRLESSPLAEQAAREISEYFAGARRKFDVPLDETQGTLFQKRVWKVVCDIPYGQTRSYREVAEMAGRPLAARAVGGAMGQTPFPVVVPCHRVISASGSLGGYGANPGEKAFLLDMEKRFLRSSEGKSYILFDLDGTLTDPKEGITRSVQYALADFGIVEPDLDALTCFIGPPLAASFQEYYGFDAAEAERAVAKYRERFSAVGIFENRVFDGVTDMLAQLKAAGKVVCLATSKPEVFARKILKKYEINRYFDIVVGSELDGRRGKKAEVIEEVLRQGEIEERRERAIMVGDRHHDIDGAKACGLASVGVTFGYAEPGELVQAGADYVVDSMDELKKLLLRV